MHHTLLNILEYSGLSLVAAIVAYPALLMNIRLAPVLRLIDWPKARGLTDQQIPIVGSSLVLISLGFLLSMSVLYEISPWFMATSFIIAVMGFLDDRKPLPAFDKMVLQIICVTVLVFMDPPLNQNLGKFGTWGHFWGAFFILGLMNAINFIDGIDGLAAIVVSVGGLGYLLLSSFFQEASQYSHFSALIFGMMVPFFYINVRHRKGFLGNVGSYFFSYVLAVIHLSLPIEAYGPLQRLSISGLCFMVPIADACMVISMRLMTLRSPFQADKGHLHHRLIQTSLPLKYILLNFAVIELTAVSISYFLVETGAGRKSLLPLFLCLSQVAVTAILILLIEKASRRRVQAYFQRLEPGSKIFFLRFEVANKDGSPVSMRTLRRLEAKIGAEIRVTDLCVVEYPNQLYITLKSIVEPIRAVTSRLDKVFQAEKVAARLELEEGQFVRIAKETPEMRKTA